MQSIVLSCVLSFTALVVVLVCPRPCLAVPKNRAVSELLPEHYDPGLLPTLGDAHPLNVSVSIIVTNLLSSSEVDQTIDLDMYVLLAWTDPRLNTSLVQDNLVVVNDPAAIKHFWTPDIYLQNSVSVSVVNVLSPVAQLSIDVHKKLFYLQRLNAKLSCTMNLQNYPHDLQYCKIIFSTLTYNSSTLRLTWHRFSVHNHNDFSLLHPSFYFSYGCELWENSSPGHSCLVGTLKIVRRLSYYIIRYYLLSFLLAAISFVGMWIPLDAWSGRITVIVVPMLPLITNDITQNNQVGVNYVVSLHWWMILLQMFVYLELIEIALAVAWANMIYDKKAYARMVTTRADTEDWKTPGGDKLVGYYFGSDNWYTALGHGIDALIYAFFGQVDFKKEPYVRNKVDYAGRILFPIAFVLFVFIYCLACFIRWSVNYYA